MFRPRTKISHIWSIAYVTDAIVRSPLYVLWMCYGNLKWLGKGSKSRMCQYPWMLCYILWIQKCIYDASRLSLHNSTPSHCTNSVEIDIQHTYVVGLLLLLQIPAAAAAAASMRFHGNALECEWLGDVWYERAPVNLLDAFTAHPWRCYAADCWH